MGETDSSSKVKTKNTNRDMYLPKFYISVMRVVIGASTCLKIKPTCHYENVSMQYTEIF